MNASPATLATSSSRRSVRYAGGRRRRALGGFPRSLEAGDILFIDEVHRLRPALEEFLYPAMEEYGVDVRIADGPHAQTTPMTLERFTLIGATPRFGLLPPPMRARFGLIERLSYYPPDDLAQIVTR